MALTRLVSDAQAQVARDFLVGIVRGTVDTDQDGFSTRMRAAQDIVRHYQTQLRFSQERITELAKLPKASADVRDYANLSDEELAAKVAKVARIVDFPKAASTGA